MHKPEVRIIDNQQVETTNNVDVSSAEAAALLAKYGYKNPEYNKPIEQTIVDNPYNRMTIDELYNLQLKQEQEKKQIEHQKMYGPKAITFDSRNIHYSNSEYKDLDIDGHNLGIQVQIVSDMPINHRR